MHHIFGLDFWITSANLLYLASYSVRDILEFGFRGDQSVLGCPSVAGATVRATYGRRAAANTNPLGC
jgi:hypothetical protein